MMICVTLREVLLIVAASIVGNVLGDVLGKVFGPVYRDWRESRSQ